MSEVLNRPGVTRSPHRDLRRRYGVLTFLALLPSSVMSRADEKRDAPGAGAPYRNREIAIDARVEDLLARMTIPEKVAQLSAFFHHQLVNDDEELHADASALLRLGIGGVSRLTAHAGRGASRSARLANRIQQFLLDETRLGIPALIHEETLSGLASAGATVFPQAINLAATFDPELVESIAASIRGQTRPLGIAQSLSPVLDVVRDPRWGRTEECFGEDPYLVAAIGVAYVRGLQGDDLRTGLIATLKHFAGHGGPNGGRNAAPIRVGDREFREIYLFPFDAALHHAGARGVMSAYHDRDGVPASSDPTLLTDLLRGEWGFDGIVVSDYGAIHRLVDVHHVAPNKTYAALLALQAGVDLELPQADCYDNALVVAVQEKFLREEILDRAVRRILRVKFELGLFETPIVSDDLPFPMERPSDRELARRGALRSIVLLKNDGILPLGGTPKLALIGPGGSSPITLVGDYSYPNVVMEDAGVPIPTLADALVARLGTDRLRVASGIENVLSEEVDVDEVRVALDDVDVIVAILGERASRVGSISGEHLDRRDLALPRGQQQILDELLRAGPPVIALLASGRPVAEPERFARCAAVLHLGFPGEEGGTALVDLLFGEVEPTGRLPLSWPRATGEIPVHYNRKPNDRGGYVDAPSSRGESATEARSLPLYPFGYGLGYARFDYRALELSSPSIATDAPIDVTVEVANTSDRDGEEVVQLYLHDRVASVVPVDLRLIGFHRVAIPAGESRVVSFHVASDQLALVGWAKRWRVEPGEFEVRAGPSSANLPLVGEFSAIGPVRRLTGERQFFSGVTVQPE